MVVNWNLQEHLSPAMVKFLTPVIAQFLSLPPTLSPISRRSLVLIKRKTSMSMISLALFASLALASILILVYSSLTMLTKQWLGLRFADTVQHLYK